MKERGTSSFSSPGHFHHYRDEESGAAPRYGAEEVEDTFDIPPPKKAPLERLRKWRQAILVVNASRRFRYTLDLKKEKEKEQTRKKIRTHAQVIRAALLFKEAGAKVPHVDGGELPPMPSYGYQIGTEQLVSMTRDHNFSALQEHGGVKGVANLLKTNVDKGVRGDENELQWRRSAFGANTYPRSCLCCCRKPSGSEHLCCCRKPSGMAKKSSGASPPRFASDSYYFW